MAHFRESNAVHLEVLEQAISVGVPIEVDIFDGANPGTMLEHLEGAEGVKFSLTMNEEGAGEFRLSRGDPKATPEIIDREHLAKIKIGGIYRFSFWMENRKIVTLTENEEAGEFWHVSGREGVYAYIDRATMDRISRIGDDPIEGVWDLTAAGTGNKLGQMLRRVLDESLAKTPSPIEFLSLSFDYAVDSLGATWTRDADVQVNVGTHLLPLAKMLSALGMDLRGRHDLRLSAYEDLGRHFEVDGGTGEVVFRAGQNVTTSLERTSEPGIRSRMLVKGTGDEFFEVLRPDLEADPYIRRREGFLSFGNSDDPTTVQRAAEAELAALASRRAAISFGADHDRSRGGYEPFVDYDLGDWTTLDEPGVFDMETVRIVGITIEQEEDDFRVILDANSIVLEEILKVARRVQNSGGGGGGGGSSTSSIGGGGGGGGSITSPAKVAVEAGDTPGFLYGKLQAGAGISLSIAGSAGNRKVEIAGIPPNFVDLGDVDPTSLSDGEVFAWDATLGLFVPVAIPGLSSETWEDALSVLAGKVHRWSFEESSGFPQDSIGSLHVTAGGGTITRGLSSPVGSAFRVTSGMTTAGIGSMPTGNNPRTIVALVRTPAVDTSERLYIVYGTGSTRQWAGLGINHASLGAPSVSSLFWGDDHRVPHLASDARWHLIAHRYHARAVGNWIDGMEIGGTMTGANLNTAAAGNLTIGAANIELSEVVVFSRWLSNAELERLWKTIREAVDD